MIRARTASDGQDMLERVEVITTNGYVGRDGHDQCGRTSLPDRSVCLRHRAQELINAVVA